MCRIFIVFEKLLSYTLFKVSLNYVIDCTKSPLVAYYSFRVVVNIQSTSLLYMTVGRLSIIRVQSNIYYLLHGTPCQAKMKTFNAHKNVINQNNIIIHSYNVMYKIFFSELILHALLHIYLEIYFIYQVGIFPGQ